MENNNNLIHNLNSDTKEGFNFPKFFSILAIIIAAGLLIGFIFSKLQKPSTQQTTNTTGNSQTSKTAGVADKKNFKDKAEGILKEGGVNGEGNFHLERPGGESQNVYLTSTTVDLSQYIGKKIRVWGETFSAQKAGWLMDVGLIESLQ